jgi:antitoxin (DNA-binding transcriptional repressor) of toxin-antitoxin stability system
MKIVGIHEAKASPSRLIERARMGEKIIISSGKNSVVPLVPITVRKGNRKLGILKGKLVVEPELFDPLPPEDLARL